MMEYLFEARFERRMKHETKVMLGFKYLGLRRLLGFEWKRTGHDYEKSV